MIFFLPYSLPEGWSTAVQHYNAMMSLPGDGGMRVRPYQTRPGPPPPMAARKGLATLWAILGNSVRCCMQCCSLSGKSVGDVDLQSRKLILDHFIKPASISKSSSHLLSMLLCYNGWDIHTSRYSHLYHMRDKWSTYLKNKINDNG